MIETLKMLAAFNENELNNILENNTTLENNTALKNQLTTFIEQLKNEFKLIVPPMRDPIKQADNLLGALLIVAQSNPELFTSDSLKKLDLISQVNPDVKGESGYLISEVYAGIDTIQTTSRDKIISNLISSKMDVIISALNKKTPNLINIVQAYEGLGKLIQDIYPGEHIDYIQKKLRHIDKYHSTALPSLKLYAALTEARIRVHDQVAALENSQEVVFMNSLSKGIAVFGTLLDAERVAKKSAEYNVTDKDIDYAKDAINHSIYEYRLSALYSAIDRMCASYEELYEGKGTHQPDLKRLLDSIQDIRDNNDTNMIQKYDQITLLLRQRFEMLKQAYDRGIKDSPLKGLFRPPNFIDYLNKKTDHHLFSRMMGVILQDLYIQRYTGTDNEAIINKALEQIGLDKLIIPDIQVYREIRLFSSAQSSQATFKPTNHS